MIRIISMLFMVMMMVGLVYSAYCVIYFIRKNKVLKSYTTTEYESVYLLRLVIINEWVTDYLLYYTVDVNSIFRYNFNLIDEGNMCFEASERVDKVKIIKIKEGTPFVKCRTIEESSDLLDEELEKFNLKKIAKCECYYDIYIPKEAIYKEIVKI